MPCARAAGGEHVRAAAFGEEHDAVRTIAERQLRRFGDRRRRFDAELAKALRRAHVDVVVAQRIVALAQAERRQRGDANPRCGGRIGVAREQTLICASALSLASSMRAMSTGSAATSV